MGFSIELSDKSSNLGYHFEEPIKLDTDKDWQICLTSFVAYNSINNVTEKNNEFDFIDDYGVHEKVSIPPGTYEVAEILDQIRLNEKAQEAKFTGIVQPNTRKIKIICKNRKVDFTAPNSLGRLLGFSNKRIIEKNTNGYSDSIVDIFPVNAIRVRCNLIESNYENGKSRGNVVYSFPLNTPTGEKIVQIPAQHRYYPLNTYEIREIFVQIVDQDNRPINFEGETITLELYIKSF
ncbi:MAG: hypothetical protein H9Q66_04845 [Spiroplasma ixodetis]|nr:hypothetical protein [Spiroplasma ixodetis]